MSNEELYNKATALNMSFNPLGTRQDVIYMAMNLARADERDNKWTPITGEESLPKDDRTYLFISWDGKYSNNEHYGKVGRGFHIKFTHYTILTKPVK